MSNTNRHKSRYRKRALNNQKDKAPGREALLKRQLRAERDAKRKQEMAEELKTDTSGLLPLLDS